MNKLQEFVYNVGYKYSITITLLLFLIVCLAILNKNNLIGFFKWIS